MTVHESLIERVRLSPNTWASEIQIFSWKLSSKLHDEQSVIAISDNKNFDLGFELPITTRTFRYI